MPDAGVVVTRAGKAFGWRAGGGSAANTQQIMRESFWCEPETSYIGKTAEIGSDEPTA
jgi:hypothetical protein